MGLDEPGDRAQSLPDSRAFVWLLFGGFLVLGALVLTRLPYNIDEGVNILYARQIADGRVPYLDFFYHQTPLHLYLLALVSPLAPDSVFLYRLPSLLATAASGLVLSAIARRIVPAPAGAWAVLLYYTVPLQHHGLLAIPNGAMMLFALLGVYGVLFRDERGAVVLGALCLVVAIVFKPLAIGTAGTVALVLLLHRRERWKLPIVAAVGVAGGLASFGALHAASDGRFAAALDLLARRGASAAIFEAWSSFAITGEMFERLGVDSFLTWNLWIHVGAFGDASVLLVPTALLGIRALRRPGPDSRDKLLLLIWIAVPAFFALFVWKAAWEHYHMQYLPALSILAALGLSRVWARGLGDGRFGRFARAAVVVWLVLCVGLSLRSTAGRLHDYDAVRELTTEGETLFTLDPFLSVVTRTRPACGLVDPLASVLWFGAESRKAFERRFPGELISSQRLIDCLEASPDTKILVSALQPFSLLFVDERLHAYIGAQGADRVIFPREEDREVFESLHPRAR